MLGIRPLYVSSDHDNKQVESLVFGSNIQSLGFFYGDVKHFEPGTISEFSFDTGKLKNVNTYRFDYIYDIKACKLNQHHDEYYLANIRNSLINAVKVRLQADQPVCFLLSGGLDSSLICSIAQSLSDKPIHTFCCGIAEKGQLANTNDIINARKVAQFIGSIHTEVTFTVQEALDAIPKVIKNIGSWC